MLIDINVNNLKVFQTYSFERPKFYLKVNFEPCLTREMPNNRSTISLTSINLQRLYRKGNYGVLWQELASLTLPCFWQRFLCASCFPFFALIEASCKLFKYVAAAPNVKMLHHWYMYSVMGALKNSIYS